MNQNQKNKRKLRNSKEWKDFRKKKMHENKVDCITLRKLTGRWALHHRHVSANMEEYGDLSEPDEFVCLNQMTHKMLHFLYPYWKKDPYILNRIEEEFERWH